MRIIFSVISREKGAQTSSFCSNDELGNIRSNSGKKDGYKGLCGIHQQVPLLPTLSIVSFPQTVKRCQDFVKRSHPH